MYQCWPPNGSILAQAAGFQMLQVFGCTSFSLLLANARLLEETVTRRSTKLLLSSIAPSLDALKLGARCPLIFHTHSTPKLDAGAASYDDLEESESPKGGRWLV